MYYNFLDPVVLDPLLIFFLPSPTSIIGPKGMTHLHILHLQNGFSGNNLCYLQQNISNSSHQGQNVDLFLVLQVTYCLGAVHSPAFPSLKYLLFSWVRC